MKKIENQNQKWEVLKDFIGKDHPSEVVKLIEILCERKHSTEDLRDVKHDDRFWEFMTLYKNPYSLNTRLWRKISLEEIIWIKLMRKVRDFGFDLNTIYSLCQMFRPTFKVMSYRWGKDEKLIGIINIKDKEMAESFFAKGLLDKPEYLLTVNHPITEFCEYLVKSICGRTPISLVLNPKGEFNIVNDYTPEGISPKWDYYATFSIFKILDDLIKARAFSNCVEKLKLVSRAEMQILRYLREDGLENLNICIGKNKKIKSFELSLLRKNITNEQLNQIKDEMKMGIVEEFMTKEGLSARIKLKRIPS